MVQSNWFPGHFIKQATHPPRGTTTIPNQALGRTAYHLQIVALHPVARRLNPYNVATYIDCPRAPLSNLVHAMDSVSTLQSIKVIYQIPCLGCDRIYIGPAGCLLGTRPKEHRSSVRRHDPNWQDTRFLGSAYSQMKRETIDSQHTDEHSVNQFM